MASFTKNILVTITVSEDGTPQTLKFTNPKEAKASTKTAKVSAKATKATPKKTAKPVVATKTNAPSISLNTKLTKLGVVGRAGTKDCLGLPKLSTGRPQLQNQRKDRLHRVVLGRVFREMQTNPSYAKIPLDEIAKFMGYSTTRLYIYSKMKA